MSVHILGATQLTVLSKKKEIPSLDLNISIPTTTTPRLNEPYLTNRVDVIQYHSTNAFDFAHPTEPYMRTSWCSLDGTRALQLCT